MRKKAPPVGPAPTEKNREYNEKNKNESDSNQNSPDIFVPIKIQGVIVDEVSEPKDDGTRGSALYKIPFKLSRNL